VEVRGVNVSQLRANLSAIVRRVEQGATIVITGRGRVVARLVPAWPRLTDAEIRASLASLDAFAEEIGRHVTEPTNVAAMLEDIRR
jgi:prevent-host-death family protein